uniref:LINE-1 type transposase domain-containing protein 1 n=1 Tax=Equus caballus TaxID=9796 RepID=UPI003D9C7214
MFSVQSKIARRAKKQQNITRVERNQLIETDQEMAQILDLKYKDISTAIMKNCEVLMEKLELMIEERKESLKNDLKEISGVKSTISDMKNPKKSSTRRDWERMKDLASQKTGLLEKLRENSKIVEDVENLTFKRKGINKPSSKLDKAKEYSTNQGKKLSPNESQNHKVMESFEEAICIIDDRCRNCNSRIEVTVRENREDELVEEVREEKIPQNFKTKEKILKVDREDEAAGLTLAADFSSATLDVRKRWSDVFNILRENDFEPKFLCRVKLAFKCDGEIRTFSDMQSLSKFTSQKSFMKELLKDVLPQDEKIEKGRKYGIQEKMDETLIHSQYGAGGTTSDGLSFLFIKEVKVAEPEEVENLETQEQQSSEWKEKETLHKEGASELEKEGEGASELEEEAEGASNLEEESEGASDLEEESEGASDLGEEGEGASELGEEGEGASVLCEEQDSNFQHHTVVNPKLRVEEIASDDLKVPLIKEGGDSEPEEKEGSEWEMDMFLTWEEGKESEAEKVKTASQIEKKGASHTLKETAFSYLASDSKKEKLTKHQMVQKTQNKETAMPRNQGTGTLCPSLCLASPPKSVEISSDKQKKHACTNLSTPSGITKLLRKTEKERHSTLQTEELTSKEPDLIQGTEENFRTSVINVFREIQEEIGNIKNCHPEVLEINSVDALRSRIDVLEERMNNLEDRIEEFSKDTMEMAKWVIKKERLRYMEDRSRSCNIRLIGIPEKHNQGNRAEDIIKEMIQENFPELKKESRLEIACAYRVPSKIDKQRLTPRHILVRFWNFGDREKVMMAAREKKEVTYRGKRIRLTADLSLDTLDARSKWRNIIRVLQSKGFNPRILYPAILAFDFEGKAKAFFDVKEFRKFAFCTPSLKELLEDII